MNRTPANNTLLGIAAALAWALVFAVSANAAASASTGGASAPTTAASNANPSNANASNANASNANAGSRAQAHKSASLHGTQIATWFGPGLYGQKTACGQTMTPVIVGVASRTLPCGTLVLVNYKGHRLTVPVIDRGPYAHNGATWDLTWGAASALSITDTVKIKTKIVGSAPNTPLLGVPTPAPLPPGSTASGGTAAAS